MALRQHPCRNLYFNRTSLIVKNKPNFPSKNLSIYNNFLTLKIVLQWFAPRDNLYKPNTDAAANGLEGLMEVGAAVTGQEL